MNKKLNKSWKSNEILQRKIEVLYSKQTETRKINAKVKLDDIFRRSSENTQNFESPSPIFKPHEKKILELNKILKPSIVLVPLDKKKIMQTPTRTKKDNFIFGNKSFRDRSKDNLSKLSDTGDLSKNSDEINVALFI